MHSEQHFELGDITAYEHAPDLNYTYVSGDATNAYNNPRCCLGRDVLISRMQEGRENKPKIERFTRSLAYLDNSYLVIFDRVNSLDASYRKAWLLHSIGKPEVTGKIIRAKAPGHHEDFDGDTVTITWADGVVPPPDPGDPGRLLLRTFLPQPHYIRRIGGEGYEFWANGKNRPPTRDYRKLSDPQDVGNWRIEVSPMRESNFDNFLHLLYPCDTRTNEMPAAEMVAAEAEKMVGLAVGGWLVMFGRKREVEGNLNYKAPNGKTRHLLVDLGRGAKYRVTGAEGGPKVITASKEGTLSFTTEGAASIRLAPLK